jgi:hypothetical protein
MVHDANFAVRLKSFSSLIPDVVSFHQSAFRVGITGLYSRRPTYMFSCSLKCEEASVSCCHAFFVCVPDTNAYSWKCTLWNIQTAKLFVLIASEMLRLRKIVLDILCTFQFTLPLFFGMSVHVTVTLDIPPPPLRLSGFNQNCSVPESCSKAFLYRIAWKSDHSFWGWFMNTEGRTCTPDISEFA